MKPRYLVTGGCGFIGSNLVRHLAPEARAIRVLDDLSLGRRDDVGDDVEVVVGDVRDPAVVRDAVRGIDRVIHLAAHTRVVESMRNPARNFDVNVRGTFDLLQACRDTVETFVFASTGGAIMGEQAPPVHEEMVPRPVAPYGAGKLAGEAYCSAFAGAYGLRTLSLRFSNVYGPRSWHKGSVVARFFRQIMRGERLTVFGDGRQTRDFLFVRDVCDGIRLAAGYDGAGGEVFHLASGRECSILELLDAMTAVVAPRAVAIDFAPARRGEVSRNVALIDKAAKMLGFSPVTRLSDGLVETWRWFIEAAGRGLPPGDAEGD